MIASLYRASSRLRIPGSGSIALALFLVPAASNAVAQTTGTTADGFGYSDSGGAVTVTLYSGTGGAIVIPGTIAGDPVTSIGPDVFVGSGPTSIAFPASVTTISIDSFFQCPDLTALTVDAGNPDFSSDGVGLFDKAKTQLFQCARGIAGTYVIPNSVTSLSNFAFSHTSRLTGITIPDSVTSIGIAAFVNTGLLSVTIPASVTSIGVDVFNGSESLTAIAVDPNNPDYGSDGIALFDNAKSQLLSYPEGRDGTYAIPSGVTSIGDAAFIGCAGLTGVTFPDGLTSIGNSSFEGTRLSAVTFPASLVAIEPFAFSLCASLTTISFLGNAPSANSTAFQSVSINASIDYPVSASGWTNPFAGLPTFPTGSAPPPPPGSARLINISTRAQVGVGASQMIPGFAIAGSGTETLLIRAAGPGLTQYGVSGVLAQPSLRLFDSASNVIASNTGWSTNVDPTLIASTAASVGAFAFASGSADCALMVSLPAGSYTVEVSGVGNTTGIALAEVYEISYTGTRLINVSTRTQVGAGGNIVIPGFVIGGIGAEKILVRADGPGLTAFGVEGVLVQPSLAVFSGQTVIASNVGWTTSADVAEIANAGATSGAFILSTNSADSAVVVQLPPGAYTAQVSGVNNTTGVALAEIYEVP